MKLYFIKNTICDTYKIYEFDLEGFHPATDLNDYIYIRGEREGIESHPDDVKEYLSKPRKIKQLPYYIKDGKVESQYKK